MESSQSNESKQAQLGLWDAVNIIVGIVIGATIYELAPLILFRASSPSIALGLWALGGVLALAGAFCYAELGTTYPRSGGDYVYLSRAYSPLVGFLFGWSQLAVILTGSIGSMAFVFARYARKFFGDLDEGWTFPLAVLAVVLLTATNILGVALGKRTQNLLTIAKVIGLGGIIVAGLAFGSAEVLSTGGDDVGDGRILGVAMILILYAYGGWNDAAFVAAEVKNRRRNLPYALIAGILLITVIYLLVNTSYLRALGFTGARKSDAVAADTFALALGAQGSKVMSLLVMISALGAVNGLIFTGSRVYSTLGQDYSLLRWLSKWHPRLGSPVWALIIQALVSIGWIAAVGSEPGQKAIDGLMTTLGFSPIAWGDYFGGFNTLFASTAPTFWLFFLLTGLSVFILRVKDKGIERPFSSPLFPLFPVIFCGACIFGLYSAIDYAKNLSLIGAVLVLIGLPLYLLSSKRVVATEPLPPESP